MEDDAPDVQALAREHAVAAIEGLAAIAHDDNAPAMVQIQPISMLLDIAHGKPTRPKRCAGRVQAIDADDRPLVCWVEELG